jgi:hypothetical protein
VRRPGRRRGWRWGRRRVVEAEDLREQDDAVEVDVAEVGGEDGGARGAVALAEEVLGRVPAVVLGEEAADEALEGVAVGVDAVEGLGRLSLPKVRLRPVPGASMKTTSLTSSREYSLLTMV